MTTTYCILTAYGDSEHEIEFLSHNQAEAQEHFDNLRRKTLAVFTSEKKTKDLAGEALELAWDDYMRNTDENQAWLLEKQTKDAEYPDLFVDADSCVCFRDNTGLSGPGIIWKLDDSFKGWSAYPDVPDAATPLYSSGSLNYPTDNDLATAAGGYERWFIGNGEITIVPYSRIDNYAKQLEKRNLRLYSRSLTFSGIARAAEPYILCIRSDDKTVEIHAGWREAMQKAADEGAKPKENMVRIRHARTVIMVTKVKAENDEEAFDKVAELQRVGKACIKSVTTTTADTVVEYIVDDETIWEVVE